MADEDNNSADQEIKTVNQPQVIYVNTQHANTVSAPTFRPEEYLPIFTGEMEEDPEEFIQDVEEIFTEQKWKVSGREKCILLHRQMRGAAHQCNRYYTNKDKDVSDLYNRLISTFGTQANFNNLRQKLERSFFNGPTEEGRLEIFIDKYVRIHKRLYPEATIDRLIQELIKAFPIHKRDSLIAADIQTIDRFVKIAKNLLENKINITRKSENFRRTTDQSPSGSVPSA